MGVIIGVDCSDMEINRFYLETKSLKLKTHPRNFSNEDLVVNFDWFAKEKFQLWEGGVVEIFPLEEKHSYDRRNHLLLEVKTLSFDVQSKGGPLSISQEVAAAFNLTGIRDVCIRRVDKHLVALDLVEFRFQDQVLSRSDMWRFTNTLIGKGMYVSRKLQFAGMLLRVSGLWAQGDKVRSGAVVDTTRVVFRSASSEMFIFLQVSSELWEFDPSGDLYFDKAVDGFLKDLFSLWKEKSCNHRVTLVLFARKYYKSPEHSKLSAILKDKKGKYYKDFYQVIVEGESRKEWSSAIIEVKRHFRKFQQILKPGVNPSHLIYEGEEYEEEEGEWVSTSLEGNILEAMNLAINVFENHYKDCSFSTTGQQVVIISPGVGAFEVDHELNILTKERIIDHGIGVDLVCLNEQPLHAVPLFKFHQTEMLQEERYHIPHWINYSFYNPPHAWTKLCFQPKIKISDHLINKYLKVKMIPRGNLKSNSDKFHKLDINTDMKSTLNDPLSRPYLDYDMYDETIFSSNNAKPQSTRLRKKTLSLTDESGGEHVSESYDDKTPGMFEVGSPMETSKSSPTQCMEMTPRSIRISNLSASYQPNVPRARHLSDNYTDQMIEDLFTSGTIAKAGSAENLRKTSSNNDRVVHKRKTFINPFDPSKVHVEASSHQCRWMHTFPRDPEGRAFQRHHKVNLERVEEDIELKTSFEASTHSSSTITTETSHYGTSNMLGESYMISHGMPIQPSNNSLVSMSTKKSFVESFATARRVGMDWTSLLEPACLPITTDFYPEESILTRDYYDYHTNLLVNSYGESSESHVASGWRSDHQNMSTFQAFKEMISQRLSQGFQLVFDNGSLFSLHKDLAELEEVVSGKSKKKRYKQIVVKFSLGRVFQRIDLTYPDMLAHIFKSKNHLGITPFDYHYQLIVNDSVEVMKSTINHVHMEDYNWNYLDQHVCGIPEFEEYRDAYKYWRFRFLLLPSTPHPYNSHDDERERWMLETINGFVKLMENLNHIKRASPVTTSSFSSSSSKRELNRLNSVPVSPYYSRQSSRSPSPTPTPLKRYTSDSECSRDFNRSPFTPRRSTTEPLSVGVSKSVQRPVTVNKGRLHPGSGFNMRRTRSREELSTFGVGMHRERETYLYSPRKELNKSPQHGDSSQSMRIRQSEDVVSNFKKLTVGTQKQRTRTNPSPKHLPAGMHDEGEDTIDGSPIPAPIHLIPVPSDYTSNVSTIPSVSYLNEDEREGERENDFESSLDCSFQDREDTETDEPPLTIDLPLCLIAQALVDKNNGVDLINPEKGLKPGCFVSMEAVNWLLENLIGEITRKEVVALIQRMVSEGLIVHASGDKRIPFVDGYYLYYTNIFDPNSEIASTQIVEEGDWESFRRRWFEVRIYQTTNKPLESLGGDEVNWPSVSSRASSFLNSAYYMHHGERSAAPLEIFNRYVELNPDTQGKSDRPEWCYLRYDDTYKPTEVYEFEFQWMAATASILNELIQGMVHKAAMCGFNLVPVHPLGTLGLIKNSNDNLHPFLHPIFIQFSIPQSILQQMKDKNQDISEFVVRLFKKILNRFGFLMDSSCLTDMVEVSPSRLSSLTKEVYVHHSGCALLQPVFDEEYINDVGISSQSFNKDDRNSCGFHWYRNHYYLRQKFTPVSVFTQYDKLYQQLQHFCQHSENGLDELISLCLDSLKPFSD